MAEDKRLKDWAKETAEPRGFAPQDSDEHGTEKIAVSEYMKSSNHTITASESFSGSAGEKQSNHNVDAISAVSQVQSSISALANILENSTQTALRYTYRNSTADPSIGEITKAGQVIKVSSWNIKGGTTELLNNVAVGSIVEIWTRYKNGYLKGNLTSVAVKSYGIELGYSVLYTGPDLLDGDEVFIQYDNVYSGVSTDSAKNIVFSVENNSGIALDALSPVQLNTDLDHSGVPSVGFCQADTESSCTNLAILLGTITNGGTGLAIRAGIYGGLNTSALTTGAVYYVDASNPSALTTVKPTYPNAVCKLFKCLLSDATNGSIDVMINTESTYESGGGSSANSTNVVYYNMAQDVGENGNVQNNSSQLAESNLLYKSANGDGGGTGADIPLVASHSYQSGLSPIYPFVGDIVLKGIYIKTSVARVVQTLDNPRTAPWIPVMFWSINTDPLQPNHQAAEGFNGGTGTTSHMVKVPVDADSISEVKKNGDGNGNFITARLEDIDFPLDDNLLYGFSIGGADQNNDDIDNQIEKMNGVMLVASYTREVI